MVRRLPRLLRKASLLAWHTGPGTTAAVIGSRRSVSGKCRRE
jgi:hypothetical protein